MTTKSRNRHRSSLPYGHRFANPSLEPLEDRQLLTTIAGDVLDRPTLENRTSYIAGQDPSINSSSDIRVELLSTAKTNENNGKGQGGSNQDDNDRLTNVIYIRDFWYETSTRGKQTYYQFFVEVAFDTNQNGIADAEDEVAVEANVFVSLYDGTPTDASTPQNIRNFLTQFDGQSGAHKTRPIKGLDPGTYYAEINDLYLDGYLWDPEGKLQADLNDSDDDSLPDFEFIVEA